MSNSNHGLSGSVELNRPSLNLILRRIGRLYLCFPYLTGKLPQIGSETESFFREEKLYKRQDGWEDPGAHVDFRPVCGATTNITALCEATNAAT
jgi:hypothetical protein